MMIIDNIKPAGNNPSTEWILGGAGDTCDTCGKRTYMPMNPSWIKTSVLTGEVLKVRCNMCLFWTK